jgi:hypothetical protein
VSAAMAAALLGPVASAAVVLASPPGVVARGTVDCDQVAQKTGTAAPGPTNQVAHARVAIPPRFLTQVEREQRPLRYWRKTGIYVRPGKSAVDISVPLAWRKRAAIQWGQGDSASGPASALHVTGCPAYGRAWLPNAGGFHLAGPACVPLTIATGGRRQTLHFGVGRRCD